MVTDIKNIAFKYVKVSGGASTIDVTMDDARFYKNKPDGYYRCFVFPKKNFAGISYNDLFNLVLSEKDDIWDETNRDTFFGYCEQTNKFVCNINAYMGLKDPDLKTDGVIQYSGMACWYEMDITSTASNGIIKIKQTDGTDTYLSIIQPVKAFRGVTGNACIEIEKKKIADGNVIEKQGALWVKSTQDNSVLMTCYCLNSASVYDFSGNFEVSLIKNNKLISSKSEQSSQARTFYAQSILYGKPFVHFPNSSKGSIFSKTILTAQSSGTELYIDNDTGKDYVEYTETSNINDILNSNEYLIFSALPKSKTYYGYNDTGAINDFNPYQFRTMGTAGGKYVNDNLELEFMSADPKNKPFLYTPNKTEFITKANLTFDSTSISDFINSIPDGIILITKSNIGINHSTVFLRFKKGEEVKYKYADYDDVISVSDASNKFGTDISFPYYDSQSSPYYYFRPYSSVDITKSDLINGTGFTSFPSNEDILILTILYPVVIYKI